MTPPDMLSAALAYAAAGLPIFPCKPGGKTPATRRGYKDATTDPDQIARWWGKNPRYNLGLPTGPASGLWVLDVDRPDGPEALAQLQLDHGPLEVRHAQTTGGGGLQLFFSWSEGVRNSARQLGPGLDVRGEGGYVIVPPSVTQGPYQWEA